MHKLAWLMLPVLLVSLVCVPGCGKGPPVAVVDGTSMTARAEGRTLEVYGGSGWRRFPVKGVNMGTALPGRWFSEFPEDKGVYRGWLDSIGAMHANTVRVYTLLDPLFYQALEEYNKDNPSNPLWLLQEIWPDDEISQNDLYEEEFFSSYREEIALDLDALRGDMEIPQRRGRAFGRYTADVYPWLLGVVLGREFSAEEVGATDRLNAGRGEYLGDYVRAYGASPSEVWTAEMCDFAVAHAQDKYGWQMPVSFVSWPTLDPMDHPTEFTPGGDKSLEADDSRVLDPRHLTPGPEAKAGLFGTYHIYPYYPDFMYREPAYQEYSDEEGILRYGAYLRQFMQLHPDYPALVGEFGLSTSLGAAHLHPEGLNHGRVSEQAQGEELARMLRAVFREGYAGGLIFEWGDEWAKRTWITMPYMIPFDRHIYWHNLMDPEQNFGLLAFESDHYPFEGSGVEAWRGEAGGAVASLRVDHDAACLYLAIGLAGGRASALKPGSGQPLELQIGLDTFGRSNGTVRLPAPGLPDLPSGVEFLLRIDAGSGGRLLARPDYNLAVSRFAAAPASDDVFTVIDPATNREQVDQFDGTIYPEIRSDESALRYGVFDSRSPAYDSLSHWYVEGDTAYVRLPWALLNVSDPSSSTVIHDEREGLPQGPAALRVDYGRDALGTEKTDGFLIFAALLEGDRLLDFGPRSGSAFRADVAPYAWPGWDQPAWRTRFKQSYEIISEALPGIE